MNSDLQTLIASVGFPIALSMYLLVRIEGKLQTLSDSINELSKNIIIRKKNINDHKTIFIVRIVLGRFNDFISLNFLYLFNPIVLHY